MVCPISGKLNDAAAADYGRRVEREHPAATAGVCCASQRAVSIHQPTLDDVVNCYAGSSAEDIARSSPEIWPTWLAQRYDRNSA